MILNKREVLIIFSSYGKEYADLLQEELDRGAYILLQDQIIGFPMQNRFENIICELNNSDFGIVIITEKDIKLHNKDLIFLVGLLVGQLGLQRFAIMLPNGYNINTISNHLSGREPNYYDMNDTNKSRAISKSIINVKNALRTISKRKTENDYVILENKKELLRIALDTYSEKKERYNPFLVYLVKCFNVDAGFSSPKVLGATLFSLGNNCLKQVGTAGIKSNHKFSLEEVDKFVVQCFSQEDDLLLGEKFDRLTGDDESYEYIFCQSIHRKYVLTVHINCREKIDNKDYSRHLKCLADCNAGYIAILELFLKGGSIVGKKNYM
ncbi:nucleotide-binding protein [Clostridium sp. YIM B02551]|uniref:nucleotide-binding protein n=1 Tax=Clostridium sp. YIM B02551 TaxID=2910679 RepID=UPI001EEB449A|nr:nucleotide-binding protein [Clostridium sp. YIM B02551]